MQKIAAFATLIRPVNALPAALLSATGGIITQIPLIGKITLSYAPAAITIAVLSNSMILNDLFDIHVDRINNPERPLVSGQISRTEAVAASILLYSITELLSHQHLPKLGQTIVRTVNWLILLYTPIFKHILLLKNIVCAGIIATTPILGALSVATISVATISVATTSAATTSAATTSVATTSVATTPLLWLLSYTIFMGSASLEILLDIDDVNGDARANIRTLPVVFGRKSAFRVACAICFMNLLANLAAVSYWYGIPFGIGLLFIQSPILSNLEYIYLHAFAKHSIRTYSKSTIAPMILTLGYYCMLAKIQK